MRQKMMRNLTKFSLFTLLPRKKDPRNEQKTNCLLTSPSHCIGRRSPVLTWSNYTVVKYLPRNCVFSVCTGSAARFHERRTRCSPLSSFVSSWPILKQDRNFVNVDLTCLSLNVTTESCFTTSVERFNFIASRILKFDISRREANSWLDSWHTWRTPQRFNAWASTRTISPKGIVRFRSWNKAVECIFP